MDKKFDLNLSQIPNELKLILEIINTEDIEGSQVSIKERFNTIDWNNFVELAMHHRIYPLLSTKLKRMDKTFIPSFVVQTIDQTYKNNTFHMLHLASIMERICKTFYESDIRVLVLKGPILGIDLYGDVSLRTSSDLDILISIDDLKKVEKFLLNLGYKKDDYIHTVLNDWKWRHHHVTYFHPQEKIKLEIHWRLNPGPSREPDFNELWDRKRKNSLIGNPVYFLGREDLFLFLVSHGARHGWSRLRWLMDINQMIRQRIDWEKLIRLLKKYQYLQVGGQALILSSQLLRTSLIEEMKPLLDKKTSRCLAQEAIFYLQNMINLHNDPVPEDVSRYHKRHLFSLMSNRQKIFFIMSFLYPYPEDAEVLPLPKSLHLLYFPLRPFLWAWRKTRKRALS